MPELRLLQRCMNHQDPKALKPKGPVRLHKDLLLKPESNQESKEDLHNMSLSADHRIMQHRQLPNKGKHRHPGIQDLKRRRKEMVSQYSQANVQEPIPARASSNLALTRSTEDLQASKDLQQPAGMRKPLPR